LFNEVILSTSYFYMLLIGCILKNIRKYIVSEKRIGNIFLQNVFPINKIRENSMKQYLALSLIVLTFAAENPSNILL